MARVTLSVEKARVCHGVCGVTAWSCTWSGEASGERRGRRGVGQLRRTTVDGKIGNSDDYLRAPGKEAASANWCGLETDEAQPTTLCLNPFLHAACNLPCTRSCASVAVSLNRLIQHRLSAAPAPHGIPPPPSLPSMLPPLTYSLVEVEATLDGKWKSLARCRLRYRY